MLFQSFFEFGVERVRFLARLDGLVAFTRGAVAFLADIVEQFVGAEIVGVDLALRRGDNFRVQPEAGGDGDGVGTAGQSNRQLESRAESLHVKFHRGVDDTFRIMREIFQFGVMGGDQGGDAAREQVREDGACQRRALLRIGARAQLVEDDQRAGIRFFQDADDVGDVTAEGAERLLDGLLVADVGVDRLEEAEFRAAFGGDVQAALRHQHDQADGFQRDGFAARVRSGDDDRARIFGQVKIYGDNGGGIEKGMTRLEETENGGRWTVSLGPRSYGPRSA